MRKDLFEQLVDSVQEMKAIQAGRRKPSRVTRAADLLNADSPDVVALRAHFKLSQAKFAALLGISVDTLQNWEQRSRQPEADDIRPVGDHDVPAVRDVVGPVHGAV